MVTNSITSVKRALRKGFAKRGEDVVVWANMSDYKDFIRMYVVSDYFRNMPEKERLGEIFSILESNGARAMVRKISLCIAMTKEEYDAEFGGDTWLDDLGESHPISKPPERLRGIAKLLSQVGYKEKATTRPRLRSHRLARAHSTN